MLGIVGGTRQQRRLGDDVAGQRFGIVGGNDAIDEADVGQVLAISMGMGIGKAGNS